MLLIIPNVLKYDVEHPSGLSAKANDIQLNTPMPAPAMYGDHCSAVRISSISIKFSLFFSE
jgi:hypothetical protein